MRYGLIGEKLGHSFSKEIHEKLADYSYDLIPLAKEEFHDFMRKQSFRAINVTIPYKRDVIPYLDEMDEKAKAIGAVNTIVNDNGKLIGHNTDFDGFLYMVRHHHISMEGKKVLVIGNGGAAQAIKAVVRHEHAKELVVVDIQRSQGAISYEDCYAYHKDAQIIVNTSPIGMYPNIDAAPIELERFRHCEAVLDVIYNPLMTKLAVKAKALGIQHVNGLEMLVAQAKAAAQYFIGAAISDEKIDSIYKELLMKQSNIVLIGMPSSGKTTIGKLLAEMTKKTVIDLDEAIVERAGMSIPKIFSLFGEEGFRHLESMLAKEISGRHDLIIATGGGIIKQKRNMELLSMNGIIVFLDRDLNKLMTNDPERPLLTDEQALHALYEERYPLYRSYADVIIANNHDIQKTAEDLLSACHSFIIDAA